MALAKKNSSTLIRDLFVGTDYHLDPYAVYDKSKSLVLDTVYHGVEMELEGCKVQLPATGGTNVVGEYRLPVGIKAHEDRSLRNGGIELVTSPLKGAALENAVEYICTLANRAGWVPSNRAGVHVHVDVQQFTLEQYLNLIGLYVLLEPCFFKAIDTNRAGSIYCKSWYQAGSWTQLRDVVDRIRSIGWFNMPSRYFGLNINATRKYGTIEFRHMQSTTDYKSVINWINTIGKAYIYARDNPISADMVRALTPEELVVKVFGDNSLADYEYPSYFYHACVPLWFEMFGPEQPKNNLDWTKRKIEGHKGYKSFIDSRPKPAQPVYQDTAEWVQPVVNAPTAANSTPSYYDSNLGARIYLTIPSHRPARNRVTSQATLINKHGRTWTAYWGPDNRIDLYCAAPTGAEQSMGAGTLVYVYATVLQ